MSQEALAIWLTNSQTILFGAGTGGFGAALHNKEPAYASQSIVNNQYIEVLTELGVIGLLVFLGLLVFPTYTLFKLRQWTILAILGALYSQWLFFSGNLNVTHLWVALAVAYALPYLYISIHEHRDTSQSMLKRV
jgi:Kef-type K+ transport system membrane component KefB